MVFVSTSFSKSVSSEISDWKTLQQLLADKKHSSIAVSLGRYRYNHGETQKIDIFQRKWYRILLKEQFDSAVFRSKKVKYNKSPSVKTCFPGEVSQKDKEEFLTNLSFVRLIAGLRPINDLDPNLNNNCQKAAWCLTVNDAILHEIPKNFKCYSDAANKAVGMSNLSYGYGAGKALFGMLRDEETKNYSAGHRRWLLNPSLTFPGYGLTNKVAVIQVIGEVSNFREKYKDLSEYESRPITWPVEGVHPYWLRTNRFSFSIANSDFSKSRISVAINGRTVNVTKKRRAINYANETVVFDLPSKPNNNDVIKVKISNVKLLNGDVKSYRYTVRIEDNF